MLLLFVVLVVIVVVVVVVVVVLCYVSVISDDMHEYCMIVGVVFIAVAAN